jgi:hypothetical protein
MESYLLQWCAKRPGVFAKQKKKNDIMREHYDLALLRLANETFSDPLPVTVVE